MKKNATHSRNQSFDLAPADDNAAGAVDTSGTIEPDNGHDLDQLVCTGPTGTSAKKGKKMSKSQNSASNSSFVSIWKPRSGGITADASKREKLEALLLDIEGLRGVSRIADGIRARIGSSEQCESEAQLQQSGAGDPSSPTAVSSNRSTDTNQEESR